MFKSLTSKLLSNFQKVESLTSGAINSVIEQVRSRTTCSRIDGKEKSVKTAMQRHFRIDKRLWIRMQPGYHRKLYQKPLEERFIRQQPVIVSRKESKMLERMSGRFYKKMKLDQFVDAPFTHYQAFLRNSPASEKLKKPTFFP